MKVLVGEPYAKVSFATEQGNLEIEQTIKNLNTEDLDFDILSIETSRDIGADDAPTYTIVLVYKDFWFEQIHGNDLVTIELGRGNEKQPVFFGLVDTIYKSWHYVDLQPKRTITIAGRGFNKALVQFGIGAVQEIDMSYQTVGFFEGQAAGFGKTTPADAIKMVLEYYMDKGIDMRFANGKQWKDYIKTSFEENPEDKDESLGNVMNYYSYQGGLWDYIKELRNAPFYEVFWEITDKKPTFIVRPTPFNYEQWKELPLIQPDELELVEMQTGRSDLETYTVFSVKGESIVSSLDQVFGQPIWYKPYYKRYGLRRLEVVSKYISLSAIEEAQSRAANMGQGMDGSNGGGEVGPDVTGNFAPNGGGTAQLGFPTASDARFTSPFGPRWGRFHYGVDLAKAGNVPIYAAEAGKISKIAYDKARGHYCDVQHNSGLSTRYQHLKSKPNLRIGQVVQRGQQIAVMGSTGKSTGQHLHFEVHVNGKAVNPAPYIGLGSKKKKKGKKGKGGSVLGPTPVASIKWEVNEKKQTSAEKKLEQGKKIYDEQTRALNEKKIKDYEKQLKEEREKKLSNKTKGTDALNKLSAKDLQKYNEQQKIKEKSLKDEDEKKVKEFADKLRAETEGKIEGAEATSDSSISQKTINLFNWNIKNNIMENGTVTLRGNATYQIGTRLLIPSTQMEYYVENVAHHFIWSEGWTTELSVTRGLPYGERFKKPWNEYSIITPEDLFEISGIQPEAPQAPSADGGGGGGALPGTSTGTVNVTGLRARIGKIAKSQEGQPYSNPKRMEPGFSDCSSFVYKTVMMALNRNYKGTRAPRTASFSSPLWYEIPLKDVQPWDIVWRPGHVEFYGDNGYSFGAHGYDRGAGRGQRFNPKDLKNGNPARWRKAYRVKGL